LTEAARTDAHDQGCTTCTDYQPNTLTHDDMLRDLPGINALLVELFGRQCPEACRGDDLQEPFDADHLI